MTKTASMKKAQLNLSFGMIFSIILIVIFLAFAFFAVKKFLNVGDSVLIGKFKDDLQRNVDAMWRGQYGSKEGSYSLPKGITEVCFADYNPEAIKPCGGNRCNELKQNWFGNENMFFYPIGAAQTLESTEIKHIDIDAITSSSNPYCVKISNGKVKLTIKKEVGENFPTII